MSDHWVSFDTLVKRVENFRSQGRTIVHCHGCFDLMHPGHVRHLREAAGFGDVLVVTVSLDRFVDKGVGRPVFDENLRAETIAALRCVDGVALNPWPTAEKTLARLRPDIYVKGQEFEAAGDPTGKMEQERSMARNLGVQIRYTHEIVFSSSSLLNRYFSPYTQDFKAFARDVVDQVDLGVFHRALIRLARLEFFLIGGGKGVAACLESLCDGVQFVPAWKAASVMGKCRQGLILSVVEGKGSLRVEVHHPPGSPEIFWGFQAAGDLKENEPAVPGAILEPRGGVRWRDGNQEYFLPPLT
ncbi:MAG: adenylyltransferase/cytidyltransferase family protein, partial [Desulfovibrionales bacterium]|nr:adenylyltransferase/cytidyltransferase family protein [Desulfovibrionales bacterium]